MSIAWKSIGSRVLPGNWTPMAWAVLVLVIAISGVTAFAAVELLAMTDQPVVLSTE